MVPRLSDNIAGTERFQLRTVFWQGVKCFIFLYLLLVAPLCENTAKHGFHHKTHSESFLRERTTPWRQFQSHQIPDQTSRRFSYSRYVGLLSSWDVDADIKM